MTLLILFTVIMGLSADWYHRKLIQEYLEPFIDRKQNAIITMPPGMGKTALVIATIVMIYIRDPKAHVIVLSNADGLAAMIVRNVLRWLNGDSVREVRPFEFSKQTETEFTIEGNDGRPSCLGASTKTVLVGARCNYLIVDDGVKDQAQALSEEMNLLWDRYTTVAESRLMAGGVVLIVGTRWGISDLIGRVINRAVTNKKSRQFQVINLALTNVEGRDSFEFHMRERP